MQKIPVLLFSCFCLAWILTLAPLQAQNDTVGADAIVGTYSAFNKSQSENYHLNFYKTDNDLYEARIVWMDRPDDNLGKPRTDVMNKKSEQRHIPLSNLVIVSGLRYDARHREWDGGRVYDPTTGKTYKCFIEFTSDSIIRMKGYVGFRILGKSLYWSKLSQ